MNIKDADFRKLQRFWYRKLRDSGFNDLETFGQQGQVFDLLKRGYSENQTQAQKESNAEYYRAAQFFLWAREWDSEVHRRMWELHSSGVCQRKIALELKMPSGKLERLLAKYKEVLLGWINGKSANKEVSEDRRKRSRRPGDNGRNRPHSRNRCRQPNQGDPQRDQPRSEEANPKIEHNGPGPSGIETFGILFTGYSRGR